MISRSVLLGFLLLVSFVRAQQSQNLEWKKRLKSAAGCPNFVVSSEWDTGFNADFTITVDHEVHGWTMQLGFDMAMDDLVCYQGTLTTTDNQNFELTSFNWDGDFTEGEVLSVQMQGKFSSGNRPDLITAVFDGTNVCGSGPPPTTPTTTTTTTTPAGPTTTTNPPPPTRPDQSTSPPPGIRWTAPPGGSTTALSRDLQS